MRHIETMSSIDLRQYYELYGGLLLMNILIE